MCLCMREKEREREGETHSCMLKETQNPVCQDRRACVCMRDDTKRMNGLNHVATPLPRLLSMDTADDVFVRQPVIIEGMQ
jgi:hypothetical protein